MTTTRFPDVHVRLNLDGPDGNAFNIMGAIADALRKAGHADAVPGFMREAMSGPYGHLVATAVEYGLEVAHDGR